jgi:Ser/Thr protein kinase RdoA (MazF antagonist)
MSYIFPVTHSVLSTTALGKTIRAEYNVSNITAIIFYQAGLNDTYLISGSTEKYILRVYSKDWRSLSDIYCEIDLLLHLHKQHIAVATPIARNDDNYITSVEAPEGTRHMVLFTYAQGNNLAFDRHSKQHAEFYGASMAAMHTALDNFTTVHKRFKLDIQYLLEQPLKIIKPFLFHRADDWWYLQQLSAQIKNQYNTYATDSLTQGYCHGDLNGENAHLHNNKLVLFDFDCCGAGNQVYDLAVFRWGSRLQKKEKQLWPYFITAYQGKRNLSASDLQAIPLFIGIRHIWHIGLHILLSADRGQHWINDQYFERQITFLKNWEKELHKA